MDPYEGMTNADVMSADEITEYDRDAELALDAADEERWARDDAQAEAPGPDDGECQAELIDGSYTYCGCEDCQEREYLDREADIEMGVITLDGAE